MNSAYQLLTNFPFVLLIAFLFLTTACVFGAYFVTRALLPRNDLIDSKDFATSVLARIGILHGLILALIFADERSALIELRDAITKETVALTNIYYNLERYDPETSRYYQAVLINYASTVYHVEWSSLASTGDLNSEAWNYWRQIFGMLLDLAPSTPRQETLRDLMIEDIVSIGDFREMRTYVGRNRVSNVVWIALFVGLVMVACAFYVFSPKPANLAMLGAFSIYNGLMIYLIIDISNPYTGLVMVSPSLFQILLPM